MDFFDFFEQICRVPRESGNEEGIRRFLLSWAEDNGLEGLRDMAGNVIIRCHATPGFEDVPPVALQGHMDMVCVRTQDSTHNFLTDPIQTVERDGYLYAKDTSLGADNGIALAMIMALFTDSQAKHGPLEAVFTFSEETGMDGAFALDGSLIKSRRMLNLDSEEEGIIYIGCAGGVDVTAHRRSVQEAVPHDWKTLKIGVNGMKGGHSGAEINRQRANAIKVLAQLLCALEKDAIPFMLSCFAGGERHNVIPSSAKCTLSVPSGKEEACRNTLQKAFSLIKDEFAVEEPDMVCSINPAEKESTATGAAESARLMRALFCTPHGVHSWSKTVEGVVQTSDNLAIVSTDKGGMSVHISVRSLSEFEKEEAASKIAMILESFGFETATGNGYPCWTPDAASPLLRLCAKAWKDFTGKDALITSMHAGLECGVINSRIPGMDSVSTGPDLFDVHSVNEHLSIESAKRVYGFVKYLLEALCNSEP